MTNFNANLKPLNNTGAETSEQKSLKNGGGGCELFVRFWVRRRRIKSVLCKFQAGDVNGDSPSSTR